MFNNEIQAIISQLNDNIPQFNGNGYYIEKGVEGFKFSDAIPFWYFIDWPEGENFDISQDDISIINGFRATANLRLIARFTGVNICDAVEVMAGNILKSRCSTFIQSISIDESMILEQDLGLKAPRRDIQMMRILFTITKPASLKCTGLICDDDTC